MFTDRKLVWHENFDLEQIVTLVLAEQFGMILTEAGYDKSKTKYIVDGFTHGFSLQFEGDRAVRRFSSNLKIRIGSLEEIWVKVMEEVKCGRYAGPFK